MSCLHFQDRKKVFCTLFASLVLSGIFSPLTSGGGTTNYQVRGVLKEIDPTERQLVIAHETIPNFMEAMTMPFNVKDPAILTNVAVGSQIRFELHVTDKESWIDRIEPVHVSQQTARNSAGTHANSTREPTANSALTNSNPLRDFKFTNELGQPVSLSDFRGQALALTFMFTRCPIPEFCPRLSRNFQQVQSKLSGMENVPTNWHLLSVTFDPAHDTSEVLKAYGTSYQYEPKHWSFLTGPADKIAELARLCDVRFEPEKGFINHNFRTLIIDPSNHLQMVFPTSGDISDSIAQELLKALEGTNRLTRSAPAKAAPNE